MSEKWAIVRIAPDQLSAEMWVDLLREEGVPASINASDAISILGTSGLSCRVLVPEGRLDEAQSILTKSLDANQPLPGS